MQGEYTPNRPVSIYGLVDPETGDIRYIGKSIRPRERLTNHCNEQSVTYRINWLKQLRSRGLRPTLVILEELPATADWKEAERRWIAHGRELGWPLTNCTSGGDGVPDLPLEIRQRMAAVWRGRKHRPETLAKIGAASRQRRHTPEWRQLMSEKMKTREFSPEHRTKLSKATSKLTPDQVRAIRSGLDQGVSQYVIAREFGVHQGTISNIKRGLCYTDVV